MDERTVGTQKDGSQELDGHEPSIEMEEKMSTHSQQYLAKDFNKMKPIIIIIDCLVQFAPLGSIHTWAYILKYTWKTWVLSRCSHCNHMFSHVPNSWRGIFSVRYISCFINSPSCFLTLAVVFFLDMGELSLTREGYTSFLGVSQELKVRVGDDVVLNCSASSSDELSFSWNKNVRKPQECAQQHYLHYTWGKLVIGCLPPSSPPSLCLISMWTPVFFPFLCRFLILFWPCSIILSIFSPLLTHLCSASWRSQASCCTSSDAFPSPLLK